jgi:hypothetical protein
LIIASLANSACNSSDQSLAPSPTVDTLSAQLVLTLPPILSENVCLPFSVTNQDILGDVQNLSANVTATLSTDQSTLSVYNENDCSGSAVTSLSVSLGESSATFYVKNTSASLVNFTIKPSAEATISVALQFIQNVDFIELQAPESATPGECILISGLTSNLETETILPDVLEFSSTTGLTAYSDAGCTTPVISATTTVNSEPSPLLYILVPSNSIIGDSVYFSLQSENDPETVKNTQFAIVSSIE